jgi:hypothetical protein
LGLGYDAPPRHLHAQQPGPHGDADLLLAHRAAQHDAHLVGASTRVRTRVRTRVGTRVRVRVGIERDAHLTTDY